MAILGKLTRWRCIVFFILAFISCGAFPVTPTITQPMPDGVDPAYVHMLTTFDATGQPKRWMGGPFHHCFDSNLAPYRPTLEVIANRISVLSGIGRTESGVCNVEWVSGEVIGEDCCPAFSILAGTNTAIIRATIHIQRPREIMEGRPAAALHEGGHVLGLCHSSVPTDLMNPDVIGSADFSANELAVLAWMYGR